jgi:hypothetical protein
MRNRNPVVIGVSCAGLFSFSVNGQLIFSVAETARANNNVAEVTCSYITGAGNLITITGVLTAR